MPWLTQSFMNPAIATVGGFLVLSPIIIHLINRMRFRRVRFAAMEFLLQAQQRNRRRILIEQLLLLLLRILIVLALVALIARLILDKRLTVFGGEGKAHHLVLLDDSFSMQNRWGETDAFKEAKETIKELVAEGGRRPGEAVFSLVLLSNPNQFFIAKQEMNNALIRDLGEKLDSLQPTSRRFSLEDGIRAAGKRLIEDRAVIQNMYVMSDYRKSDWEGDESLAKAISELETADTPVTVNLVRCIEEHLPNLGVTTLEGNLKAAAVGVPVELKVGVTNFGSQAVENVRLNVIVDGEKLPLSAAFDKIEAGKEETQTKRLAFRSAGPHSVEFALEEDSLSPDNKRFLTVNVPLENNVLIIGNEVDGDAEEMLRFALSPVPGLTGVSAQIETASYLRTETLDQYRAIYILNQAKVPLDAIARLESYVRGGGGLVWFLGDQVNPDFYNKSLSGITLNEEGVPEREKETLFPVYLADSRSQLQRDATNLGTPDFTAKPGHPIFDLSFSDQNPLAATVRINYYIPVHEKWANDDTRKDNVATIAQLSNQEPLVFEHQFERGRVVTFLTSAGLPWTNLHTSELYLSTIQDLQKYVAKPEDVNRQREVGTPIVIDALPVVDYDKQVSFTAPDGTPDQRDLVISEDNSDFYQEEQKSDTYLAGMYSYELTPRTNTLSGRQWFAYNVPPEEGKLEIADDKDIKAYLPTESRVQIWKYGDKTLISSGVDPGQEVTRKLIYLLLVLLVLEQAMAYRLSYHPDTGPAPATA